MFRESCLTLVLVAFVLGWNNGIFSDRPFNLDYDHRNWTVEHSHEHFINVPFHYQEKSYYCGPASLQMVFDYYGECISQLEIAEVARTVYPVTYTDDLRRAGHFSNLSTSMGTEMEGNITGYTARKLGYASFEISALTIEGLKVLIDQDYPLILLMRWKLNQPYGHFRVAVGYNETHIFLHDPWYGTGPNIAMNYDFFDEMWDYSGHWALFVSPWKITVETPKKVGVGQQFIVKANITYVSPSNYLNSSHSYPIYDYPASSCNATIVLPEGLVLSQNETMTKPLGTLNGGATIQVAWRVQAIQPGNYNITIIAKGEINGFVGEKPNVGPCYTYKDIIGGYCSASCTVLSELHDLAIINVTLSSNHVYAGQNVTITVYFKNEGIVTESLFSLTTTVNSFFNESIYFLGVSFDPGEVWNFNFTWSTFNVPAGNYTVTAEIGPQSEEFDIEDNIAQIYILIDSDEVAPSIFGLSQSPELNQVQPYQNVTIFLSASDNESGIGGGFLFYSVNSLTWNGISMELIPTDCGMTILKASIPGFQAGTEVKYWIKVWDRAGNTVIVDNDGQYYAYIVIPELPLYVIILAFPILSIFIVLFRRKSSCKTYL